MAQLLGLLILLAIAFIVLQGLFTLLVIRGARRPPRHTAGYALAHQLPCDPGDLDLPFESWLVTCRDGVQLPVWEIACTREKTNDRLPLTLVMVHGWGQSRLDMLTYLEPFLHECQRIILYDLRGHGDAEESITNLGCREEDDLLALLTQLGDGQIILAGYSMGSVIALHTAAASSSVKQKIVGIIAHSPYIDFHTALRGRLMINGYPARPMSRLAMWWFAMIGLRHRDLMMCIGDITCPILVVHGKHDAMVPIKQSHQIAQTAQNGLLHVLEHGNHLDLPEEDREGYLRIISNFLREFDQ